MKSKKSALKENCAGNKEEEGSEEARLEGHLNKEKVMAQKRTKKKIIGN
jgi:hypothetical protein